jgi:hypothetical protein
MPGIRWTSRRSLFRIVPRGTSDLLHIAKCVALPCVSRGTLPRGGFLQCVEVGMFLPSGTSDSTDGQNLRQTNVVHGERLFHGASLRTIGAIRPCGAEAGGMRELSVVY